MNDNINRNNPTNKGASSRTGEVKFPKLESWNEMTQVATIAAVVNKRRVLCRVSLKILIDRFGASEENPMQSVAKHRDILQKVAKNLIENENYEEDGSILIRARNL